MSCRFVNSKSTGPERPGRPRSEEETKLLVDSTLHYTTLGLAILSDRSRHGSSRTGHRSIVRPVLSCRMTRIGFGTQGFPLQHSAQSFPHYPPRIEHQVPNCDGSSFVSLFVVMSAVNRQPLRVLAQFIIIVQASSKILIAHQQALLAIRWLSVSSCSHYFTTVLQPSPRLPLPGTP